MRLPLICHSDKNNLDSLIYKFHTQLLVKSEGTDTLWGNESACRLLEKWKQSWRSAPTEVISASHNLQEELREERFNT